MSEDTNKMVVENKKEVSLEKAQTIPGKQYIPATDIAETDK